MFVDLKAEFDSVDRGAGEGNEGARDEKGANKKDEVSN